MEKYTFFLDKLSPRKVGEIAVGIVITLFLLFVVIMLIMGVKPIQKQIEEKDNLNTINQEISIKN